MADELPASPTSPYDWAGFYIGAHAGSGEGDEHDNQSQILPHGSGTPTGTTATTGSTTTIIIDNFDLNGFIGGVHAGYSHQMGRYVLGVEGDLDYSGIKGGQDGIYWGAYHRRLDFESRWQGSVRLRVGFTPIDRLLVYVTGGLAIGEGRLSSSDRYSFTFPSTTATNTHLGWTAGAGADYALSDHWIVRIEARYSEFGSKAYATGDGPVTVDWTQLVGLAGVSYKY